MGTLGQTQHSSRGFRTQPFWAGRGRTDAAAAWDRGTAVLGRTDTVLKKRGHCCSGKGEQGGTDTIKCIVSCVLGRADWTDTEVKSSFHEPT